MLLTIFHQFAINPILPQYEGTYRFPCGFCKMEALPLNKKLPTLTILMLAYVMDHIVPPIDAFPWGAGHGTLRDTRK